MVNKYTPKRGDIVYANFDPQKGREQSGRRPALVLSPEKYNKIVGLIVLCPITNQQKGYVFEVPLTTTKKTTGVVLADQIKNFDWENREVTYIEKIGLIDYQKVTEKIATIIER